MPLRLAVSSALDAVAHCGRELLGKGNKLCVKSSGAECRSGNYASSGRTAFRTGRRPRCNGPGSMLAGLAFSNTKTTACHSISYPLTMHYNIPHGTAVSMLLGPVFRMNAEAIEDRGALLQALGVSGAEELKETHRQHSQTIRTALFASCMGRWQGRSAPSCGTGNYEGRRQQSGGSDRRKHPFCPGRDFLNTKLSKI